MKRWIYMNEKIREAKPSGPVIAVQCEDDVRNTNRVQLVHDGKVMAEVRFDAGGLQEAPQHHVRAFVEVSEHVTLRYPRKVKA